jgi:hypothetical protein
MRSSLPFDTHAYVKRLVAAGMPEAQAEVQAEALAEIVLAQVATKDDVRLATGELKRDLEQATGELKRDLEQATGEFKRDMQQSVGELKRDMELLETRLTARLEAELRKQLVWFFGMLVVLAGALVAILRAIPAGP